MFFFSGELTVAFSVKRIINQFKQSLISGNRTKVRNLKVRMGRSSYAKVRMPRFVSDKVRME